MTKSGPALQPAYQCMWWTFMFIPTLCTTSSCIFHPFQSVYVMNIYVHSYIVHHLNGTGLHCAPVRLVVHNSGRWCAVFVPQKWASVAFVPSSEFYAPSLGLKQTHFAMDCIWSVILKMHTALIVPNLKATDWNQIPAHPQFHVTWHSDHIKCSKWIFLCTQE